MKKCETHPDSDRYANGRCRQCDRESSARYRMANPEKARAAVARWQKAAAVSPCKKHPNSKRRKNNACAECSNEATARWRERYPEKVAEANRRSRNSPNREAVKRRSSYKHQGMDPRVAEATLAAHDGKCGCCGCEKPGGAKGWNVDHEHSTGRIRGILCNHCNLAIGRLGDTLEGVLKAVKYLQRA